MHRQCARAAAAFRPPALRGDTPGRSGTPAPLRAAPDRFRRQPRCARWRRVRACHPTAGRCSPAETAAGRLAHASRARTHAEPSSCCSPPSVVTGKIPCWFAPEAMPASRPFFAGAGTHHGRRRRPSNRTCVIAQNLDDNYPPLSELRVSKIAGLRPMLTDIVGHLPDQKMVALCWRSSAWTEHRSHEVQRNADGTIHTWMSDTPR